MAGSAATSRFLTSGRRLYLIGGFLIAATLAATTLVIWERRQETIASYQREMTNLSVTLAEQTARSMQAIDLVIREIQERLRATGEVTAEQFAHIAGAEQIHLLLSARLTALPQADAISLLDADGFIINGSRDWPEPRINFSDRDYYRHFREQDDPGVFVSAPVHGRFTGAWTFFLARRINGPRGEFFGVALCVIRIPYFEEFYKAITLQPGGSVSIFRRDGTMLARYPHVEAMMGQKLSDKSGWYLTVAHGGGTYTTPGYIDGTRRIVSVRPMADYPLVVGVTVPAAAVLTEWRQFSATVAALGAFVATCFGVLFATVARRTCLMERQTAALEATSASLADSEARFRGFAETSSDWLWETDEQHRLSYISEGVSTTGFGIRPRDLIGRTRMEVAADTGLDPQKWQAHHELLERHEPFRDFTYTWASPDRHGTASINGDPCFGPEGRFCGYRGTGRDISGAIAAETELTQTLQHLDRVQRIAGIGSLEVELTGGIETIKWSANACMLFGVDSNEVDCSRAFLLQCIHPDDRAMVTAAADTAVTEGVDVPPLEYRIVRPDGAERFVYRESAIRYDAARKLIGRTITYKDITEFKQTEALLRETMSNLERAQRLARMGTDVWDLRTNTVTWSDGVYRIFGVEPGTFTPSPESLLDLVVPEDQSKLLLRQKRIRQGKDPPAAEFTIRRPDGELRRIYSEAELVLDEKGQPIRWVGTRQDITEQWRAERGLREAKESAEAANRAKSQFLANMSHELRTPLNAVIGFSEALELGLAEPLSIKQAEYVGLIRQSGQHLCNVINDILDLTKVDAGKFELHEEAGVDPSAVVASCLRLMKGQAETASVTLSAATGPGLPSLMADETRLKQIVLNLVSNAIKFTAAGGSVDVIVGRDRRGDVAFEVRDTGIGMNADEIRIALQPFGQVETDDARRYQGTGLGLPLAQRLAELHGGSLRVHSRKGQGTKVVVTLPAWRVQPSDEIRDMRDVTEPTAA